MKNRSINFIQRIFCATAGAYLPILEKCPTQITKYHTMGVILWITAMMASLSGGYFFYTAFDDINLAILFGLFWGFTIFSLDRYLVVSLNVNQNQKQKFIKVIPRIFLAICLGLVVAKPLELKLFEKEIKTELELIKNKLQEKMLETDMEIIQISNNIKDLEKEKVILDETLSNKIKEVDIKELDYYNEKRGESTNTTTGRVGYGPEAKRKEIIWLDIRKENQSLLEKVNKRKDEIDIEIAQLRISDKAKDTKIQKTAEQNDGPLARIEALSSLTDKKTTLKLANFILTMIFILIEIAPIVVKLVLKVGLYEELLEAHEKEKIKTIQEESNFQEYKTRLESKRKKSQYNGVVIHDEQLKNKIRKNQFEIDAQIIDKRRDIEKIKLEDDEYVEKNYREIFNRFYN